MKRILTSVIALAFLIGTPVLAQDRPGKHDRAAARADKPNKADRPARADRPNRPDRAAPANRTPRADAARRDRDRAPNRVDRNRNDNRRPNVDRNNRRPNVDRNDNRRPNVNRNDNRRPNVNRNDNRNRNFDRNRQRPRQFDRRSYQRNFNAHRKFRGGYYNKPRGWYYRRWSYGQILPFAFFARDYWLNDYYAYDLPVPPYGYEWVRYGDDAILVDVRTGAILQVQYGVFY